MRPLTNARRVATPLTSLTVRALFAPRGGWSSFCSPRSLSCWPILRSPIRCCRRSGAITNTRRGLANLPMVTRTAQGIPGDPDQCRPDRRQTRRALRHAGGGLVSGRPGDGAIVRRDRRQRAARPSLSPRAGQSAVLSRPPRGSRLREAGRPKRRSPPSCAVLESFGSGTGKAPGLARRRHLRSRRRRQPLYRRHHPSYLRRYRRRAEPARL